MQKIKKKLQWRHPLYDTKSKSAEQKKKQTKTQKNKTKTEKQKQKQIKKQKKKRERKKCGTRQRLPRHQHASHSAPNKIINKQTNKHTTEKVKKVKTSQEDQ